MPNSRSAKKRMRQAQLRLFRNRAARSALRTAIKQARTSTGEAARTAYQAAERLLDRAAQRGLIHKNAAARTKQRLHKLVSKTTN